MRIVVLGGAGIVGRAVVRDLAGDSGIKELIVADRDGEAAERVAAGAGRPGVTAAGVDVADHIALVRLLKGSGAVVNAVQYDHNVAVMTACLDARTHYIDLGGLFHTTRKQMELEADFRRAGILGILGLGSCPGVANLQARALADGFDSVESIRIYNGATAEPGDACAWPYSIETILDEISMPPVVFRNGQFIEAAPLGEEEIYRFPEPVGALKVHLSLHSEVATLPLTYARKGIRECVFKISFFGLPEESVRRLQMLTGLGLASREPIEAGGVAVRPRELLIALLRRAPQGARAPGAGVKAIVTEVRGLKGGRAVTGRAETLAGPQRAGGIPGGTLLVASAPAIVARWLAAGRIKERGVMPPEQVVETAPFFRDLEARGARTTLAVAEPYPA